ncbi:Ubiquitin-associated protein 2-like [Saguinus oedipus]|uniref:Ubiquitin-associated protein 2-like n=1 Tax=Saguinus oedipus TaxID=9490 RepID=A0ABQ9TBF1_SAGOE|nr:Ubiquitin-associated protein 2-like [Saguinus oedipus]KAK2082307.1 Ubiquitin-associated protein 2-like [Saguinus oedipus]
MSTEPSMFSWKETQTGIPGRWSGRRRESQARRMVARWNTMRKAKKIETGKETIVGDMVGHQDGGDVPAMDESVCMGLYQNQLWFKLRKMAPRVEGLLEEEWKEEEGAMAEAEVALVGEEEADYAEPANTDDNYGNSSGNTWNNTGHFEPDDGMRLDFIGVEGSNYPRKFKTAPSAWRTATEGWGTEDWNEDLSETKIFTASNGSSVPLPAENVTITAISFSGPASGVQQFKADSISQPASGNTFSYHSMVSMLGKVFGDVGEAKGGSTTGSQFLEQFKTAQSLAQLAAQHSQTESTTTSSWDMGSMTQSPSLVQYNLKNPNDSTVHSFYPIFNHDGGVPSGEVTCSAYLHSSTSTSVFSSAKQIHIGSINVTWIFRQPVL